MTDAAKLVERLRALEAKSSAGPWVYRPDKHDDWGVVKGPKHRPDGWEYDTRWPLARFRLDTTDEQESEAREAGRDPWRADAEFVVEMRNALPDLLEALTQSEARRKADVAEAVAAETERCAGICAAMAESFITGESRLGKNMPRNAAIGGILQAAEGNIRAAQQETEHG